MPIVQLPDKNKSHSGFTVIEMIIAFSIFSVLAVMLYSTFASGLRIFRQAENNESMALELLSAFDLISSDLENMVSYQQTFDSKARHQVLVKEATRKNVNLVVGETESGPASQTGLTFSGDSSSFSLLRPTPEGLKIIRYSTKLQDEVFVHQESVQQITKKNVELLFQNSEGADRKQALVREESPFGISDEEEPRPEGLVELIFDNLPENGLKFSYALRDPASAGELLWKESWDSLCWPMGVRMEMTLASAAGNKPTPWIRDIMIPSRLWSQQECKE